MDFPDPLDNTEKSPWYTRYPYIRYVADGVYLSNYIHAQNYEWLKEMGVRQILTLGEDPRQHKCNDDFKLMRIWIGDSALANIKQFFPETNKFIEAGPTLVHCRAGHSRSPALIKAYLMYKYKKTLEEVDRHFCEKDIYTKINAGFHKQLQEYELELFGVASDVYN